MLHRIVLSAIAAPRRIIAVAALLFVGAAVFGLPAVDRLTAGGFQDPSSESARAARTLTDTFGRGGLQLVFTVTDPAGADSDAARAAGREIADRLSASPHVVSAVSAWSPPAPPALVSRDGRSGLVIAEMRGGEDTAPRHAQALADEVADTIAPRYPGVSVLAGGSATVFAQITSQTQHDVLVMEAIAVPLSFLVLVWVFRGLLAAAVPVAVGALAIAGSLAVLRVVVTWTDVSIFALNLTTALGLALAIDYTLLIVSRYRDELAGGADRDQALITTMTTAGRTVVFSALTVALSLAAMVLFPMYFLKSFAYAGVATVVLCASAAIVVTPAAIALLGSRLDALGLPRVARESSAAPRSTQQMFWYRSTTWVMRRAVAVVTVGAVLLLGLGLPFLRVSWGLPDDRVLPRSASAHQVGDMVRSRFADNSEATVTVVVPDATGLTYQDYRRYAIEVSRLPDVSVVSTPDGTFAAGQEIGPGGAGAGAQDGSAFLTVGSSAPVFSAQSRDQLDRLHALAGPGGRDVELAGLAQISRDSVHAITARLPTVLLAIAVVTFLLLFLLTGSVVVPLKALLLNTLSLTAAFGALVWIFQEGHLGAFGTTPTGTLVAEMPVLLFCIAFGLSMDYEVFLIARIREAWLAGDGTRADSDESVAVGLAHTGRVVTAAALVMSMSFGALIAAQVSFMRMFGLGLTLAVLIDATLVRMMLLPALMHLMGRWNWWAPAPLARLHSRIGFVESASGK
ncbi:putative RND superfamily drug exporter [Mycolicibacterium chubuense NBB4]|uniref:Putative RND superfamily drug exporter n=1 Tax=Mycolicibacterium chubuense (strain NBB4) TaxID=710421 RepID=I4BFC9_MYCCN|nr:MMPL family transporter [Mycolicibacterium chubuense]AFM15986.1 putative RND superfamily drug exporter [Mycolicibacterium chubuense NBB4]